MSRARTWFWTTLVILSAVLFARATQPYFNDTNVAMVYMLAVVVVAVTLGLWPAVASCVLGVVLFDFVNVAPYFQFTRQETEYAFTLGVMLVTALTISTLANRLKRQVEESDLRARCAAALYELSAELAGEHPGGEIDAITRRHLERAFPRQGLTGGSDDPPLPGREQEAHRRAMLRLADQARERISLRERVSESETRAQQEALRSSILGAVSHDLRTPLATIIGASSTLLQEGDGFAHESRQRLRRVIYEEAVQMQRMVENLLDLARVRSGDIGHIDAWEAPEEIVGSTLATMRARFPARAFVVDVPPDLPLIRCDGVLLERVLANLVENAVRFSSRDEPIEIRAGVAWNELVITVRDHGSGIPAALHEKVFEPFFSAGEAGGSGLGLAICRGIVEAYGGHIGIEDPLGGGTRVRVVLPVPAQQPPTSGEE